MAFNTPPTSLVRSKRGSYAGVSDVSGASTISGAAGVSGAASTGVVSTASGAAIDSVARGITGVIGMVGSNNPGPSYRLTGDDASREVRRGTLPVLLPDLRAGLAEAVPVGCAAGVCAVGCAARVCAGLAAGFGNCVTRAVVFVRGELKSRGDDSRRSSKVQPRGKVKRAA